MAIENLEILNIIYFRTEILQKIIFLLNKKILSEFFKEVTIL